MKNDINERGRSMTEMLGVLAVIGVLSIGGIQGYTYAMNKYRANSVLNEINMVSLHLSTTLLSSLNATKVIALGKPYDSGKLTSESYPFDYGCGTYDSEERACHQEETGYWTKISAVSEKVCQQILSEAKHLSNIVEQRLNGVAVEDGSACGDNSEIMFLFNADGSGVLAKNCGSGSSTPPEETTPTVSCPANTSKDGQGGLATTLTDETTGTQIQCYCVNIDTKYTNGLCETLPETCNKNDDCNRGEYCNITDYGSDYCTTDTSDMTGKCQNASNNILSPNSGTNPPFIMSNSTMNWWTAVNFCQALGKKLVDISDYGCAHTICASGCDGKWGYCHTDPSISVTSSSAPISPNIVEMKEAYGSYNDTWTNTDYNTCNVYTVDIDIGYVNYTLGFLVNFSRKYNSYAVCK